VHGCTGTMDVADTVASRGVDLLEVIGRSLAYLGTNAFIETQPDAEILVALPPPWVDLIHADFPELEDVQARLFHFASAPADAWPEVHRAQHQKCGRVGSDGRLALVASPEKLLVFVCGGLGNLHALALHSFGPTKSVTRPF